MTVTPTDQVQRRPDIGAVAGTAEIRSHFPALERMHAGAPVAYFDGPGGTQVPRSVGDAVSEYLYHHNANTHWAYPTSEETDAALSAARTVFADFFHASPHEIVFGANMTTLTFHVARALGRSMRAGDEIVVTELDHHGNVEPWTELTREFDVVVRKAAMNPETGQLDWEDLTRLIGPRTRVVAIGAASNALGTINDIGRAVTLARSVGALVFVDAVHLAAHQLLDVRRWDCDFLVCSAYKFYGPHVGVLVGRRDHLRVLSFPKVAPASDQAPERVETGTLNHEGIVGAAAAVKWLASLAATGTRRERLAAVFGTLHERGAALTHRLWEGLQSVPRARVFGPPPGDPEQPRTPTVSFVVTGQASAAISASLAEAAVFTSHGDFYAQTVVERLGMTPSGLVRAGCACYTTEEEVDRLVDGVRSAARGRVTG